MTKETAIIVNFIDSCPTEEARQFILRIVRAFAYGGKAIQAELFEAATVRHASIREIEAILEKAGA